MVFVELATSNSLLKKGKETFITKLLQGHNVRKKQS